MNCKNNFEDTYGKYYKLDILGISESRWTKSGRMKTSTGETILYSEREDNLHQEGVAIIMKKGMEKCLMQWKPVNSRIILARLKGRQTILSIIQCYAPTNDSDDMDKERSLLRAAAGDLQEHPS